MRKLLWIIGLVFLLFAMTHKPSLQAQLPPAYQRNPLDTNGPVEMTNIVIAIAGGGPSNGITINIFYSTNIITTNIIAQTINAISNFVQNFFSTTLVTTNLYASNFFATYVTIVNGNGPWILTNNGIGYDTTIYRLQVHDDFAVIGPGSPIFELANGDTMVDEAGYDIINHGGWWGSISPTNLDFFPGANILFTTNNHQIVISASGVLSSGYYASNAISGGTFPLATLNLINATNNDVVVSNALVALINAFGLGATNNDTVVSNALFAFAQQQTNNFDTIVDVNSKGTVISNGVVAHTITISGTANQISSSVGTAQPLSGNPATTISLPNPLIAPGKFSANGITNSAFTTGGVVTNDLNGNHGTTTIVPAPFLGTSTANSTTVLYGDNVWRNPTNAGVTIPTTVISTNWVLNQTYTNSYGTAIQVDASVALHGAAVSGSAAMDLFADQQNNGLFTLQDRVAVSTILTSIVTDYTNSLACILTNLARFYFTNSSTGVGNLSSIVPATGQLTIFGDVFAAGVVGQNRTLTINGTANQITVTGGSQDLSADRTWTVSISAAPQFNGQNVTNVLLSDLVSPTNGVSSATAIDFSVPEATTNITANIAFTSIVNFNSTNYNYAIRHIINTSGGNLTETVGTGWRTDPNARTTVNTYTMTNNCVIDMLFEAQINQFTNAFILFASP